MDTEEIVEQLTAVDLPEDQARLYVQLVKLGPTKARTISDQCGFSRSKTYRLLDDMVETGIVTASVTQPRIYTPEPPDDLFDRLRTRWQRGVERTETARKRASGPLQRLWGSKEAGDEPSWSVIGGRREILDRTMDLFETADESVIEFTTHGMCTTFTPPVRQTWETALGRVRDDDLAWRLLLSVDDPGTRRTIAETIAGTDAQVRSVDPGYLVHFLVVDGERALLYLDQSPSLGVTSDQDVAILSDTRGLVESLTMFFDLAWPMGTEIEAEGIEA